MLDPFFRDAYLADLGQTAENIERIDQQGFTSEAIVLVTCFIESLGKDITQGPIPSANFRHALIRCSGEPFWAAVHPGRLEFLIAAHNPPGPTGLFSPGEFHTAADVRDRLRRTFGSSELAPKIDSAISKATAASCAYDALRSRQVHNYSSGIVNLRFSDHAFDGRPAPNIDLEYLLHSCRCIIEWMRANQLDVKLFTQN